MGAPIVAIALKSPLEIRSISSSICCSVVEGALRIVYDECGFSSDAVACVGGGAVVGGKREKREGEGAMNDKYWSTTFVARQSNEVEITVGTNLFNQIARLISSDRCGEFF
jgi:hypothetical protein